MLGREKKVGGGEAISSRRIEMSGSQMRARCSSTEHNDNAFDRWEEEMVSGEQRLSINQIKNLAAHATYS